MKIDKNKPMPPARSKWLEKIRKMNVGDSFTVDCREAAQSCQTAINSRNLGMSVSYRKDGDLYRIWRTE